jgi:hypothetical protein
MIKPPPLDPEAEYGPDLPAPSYRALRSLERAPERMPPARRQWFRDFILRTNDRVLDPACSATERGSRLEWWDAIVASMVDLGVASAILRILDDVFDPDGKDERRGWTYGASCELSLLETADVREFVLDMIHTTEFSVRQQYPSWYRFSHNAEAHDWERARAVKLYPKVGRWRPMFAPDEIAMMQGLLDDGVPLVRFSAAIVIAEIAPESAGERTVARLVDAMADRRWVWSHWEVYNNGTEGAETAAEAAGRIGPAARTALPAVQALLEDLEYRFGREHDEMSSDDKYRLIRLRKTVTRLREA